MVCCVWILMVSHHWWPFTLKLHFLGRTLDNTMSDSHTQESRQFCGGGWEGGGMTGMSQHSNIDDMWQHRLERVGVQRFVMAKIEDQSGQTLPLSLLSGEGTALLERTRGRGSTTTFRHCQLSRNNNYLKLWASWNQESPISNHYWWQKLARYYTRGHDRILGWSVTATLKLSWFNSAVEILPRWQAGKNIVITPLHPPSRFVVAPQIAGR